MRRITAIAVLPAAALVLAACGGGAGQDTAEGSGPAATLTSAEPTETEAGAETPDDSTTSDAPEGGSAADDALFGTPSDVGGPYGELRDGLWGVGPAGEVEFTVTGRDSLELVQVRPNDGWQINEQEVESDKIDIDFRRGEVKFEIEIEMDSGVLEIEIDQEIESAQSGTYSVGEAATVDITVEGDRLVLGDVVLNDGWDEVKRDTDDDDVELDFRRSGSGFFELWEFDADLDDGELKVEIDYEIEGSFPQ